MSVSSDSNSSCSSLSSNYSELSLAPEKAEDGDNLPGQEEPAGGSSFKIVSWNINGMRTLDMPRVLEQLNCSVLAVQETKISRKQLEQGQVMPPGYSSYFSFSTSKVGYSGVAIYCKNEWTPAKAEDGLSITDTEPKKNVDVVGSYPDLTFEETLHVKAANLDGRTVITQHLVKLPSGLTRPLTVINVYCPRLRSDPEDPTNNRDLKRCFHEVLHRRAKRLVQDGSFVLVVGDINISHRILDQSDITDPKKFIVSEFRELLNEFVDEEDPTGFVDTFRKLHPTQQAAFTCWCTRLNARENNYGSRIDYIFADRELAEYLESAEVHPDMMGSDHCPISATFHSLVPVSSDNPPSFSTKHYPEFSGKQKNLKEFFQAPLSTPTGKSKSEKEEDGKSNVTVADGNRKRPLDLGKGEASNNQKTKRVQTSLNMFFNKTSSVQNVPSPTATVTKTVVETNDTNATFNGYRSVPGNSEAWKKLMKPPVVPLCEGHKEPCVKRTVTKKGVNFGRQFWSCSHGEGKAGDPNANCKFFQWARSATSKN
ncbi:unnamed protein product [Orchesella dallaii]|uniref:DNA-(apurinic or apyrimidinic site) endonuclease n=1 Tax=Orchesella dallaii TaxID=48710 RepID=A0ABP1PY48_9HEXA